MSQTRTGCQRLMDPGMTINRPPRDGHMAFVRSPDNISIELLKKRQATARQGALDVDGQRRRVVGGRVTSEIRLQQGRDAAHQSSEAGLPMDRSIGRVEVGNASPTRRSQRFIDRLAGRIVGGTLTAR